MEEFVREGWHSWQEAMAAGWVGDWVEAMCDSDVVLRDCFTAKAKGLATPEAFHGKGEICQYYAKLIATQWRNGCVMTWHTNSITSTAEDTVACDYETRTKLPHGRIITRRHSDIIKVKRNKIVSITFNPLECIPSPRSAGHTFTVAEKLVRAVPPTWEKRHMVRPVYLQIHPQDLCFHAWHAWQRAMEGGWVHEWVRAFCTEDVVFQKGQNTHAVGIASVVDCYNHVLTEKWGLNAVIQWHPHRFIELSPTQVISDHVITVKTSLGVVSSHTCVFYFEICGSRLSVIKVGRKENGGENLGSRRGNVGILRLADTPMTPVAMDVESKPASDEKADSDDNAGSGGSSNGGGGSSSGGGGGGGVAPSERVCEHNSWDNVRIKRGWLVLRCRVCHAKWRQRPTVAQRCAAFSEGRCNLGKDCPCLHVHHTKHTKVQRDQVKLEVWKLTPFFLENKTSSCEREWGEKKLPELQHLPLSSLALIRCALHFDNTPLSFTHSYQRFFFDISFEHPYVFSEWKV